MRFFLSLKFYKPNKSKYISIQCIHMNNMVSYNEDIHTTIHNLLKSITSNCFLIVNLIGSQRKYSADKS